MRTRFKNGERAVECNQANFNLLPGLVSRADFLYWTGYSEEDLDEAVKGGEITVHRRTANGYAKYYKVEIARITGFRL